MGGSTKRFLIENEGVLCPRRGRDTQPVRKLMMQRVRLGTPKLGRDGAAGLTWQCVPVEGGGKCASALGAWCTE